MLSKFDTEKKLQNANNITKCITLHMPADEIANDISMADNDLVAVF